MNIQTEHLEELHAARATVEVEPERIRKAFEQSARKLAQRANIPGFRKGKAPYAVILRYFGTQGLLEESIETIADDVYKRVLEETKLNPYTAGSLDDIKADPAEEGDLPKLTLIFTIPKQPEVDLNDYRELRMPFEPVAVTDAQVDQAILRIREGRAVIEPASRPVELGDKVKVKVTGTLEHKHVEYDLTDEQIESDEAVDPHHDEEPINEDQEIILRTGVDDEIMPGFSENIIGMTDGETKEFVIEFGADSEYDNWANHTAKLKVEVSEVRSMTLPALNDEFAQLVSEGKLPTLLDYRIKIREDLQAEIDRTIENNYAEEALDLLTEGADMAYPEIMVQEYIDDILKELENNLRERGLSLDQFLAVEQTDKATLRASYRDLAIRRLERSLALGSLVANEQLTVTDDDVDQVIDNMLEDLGEQAATFRKLFNNAQSRSNIAMDLIKDRALARLTRIMKGEDVPSLVTPPAADAIAPGDVPEAAVATEQGAADGAIETPPESQES